MILAYYHGAPGKDEGVLVEKIFVSTNMLISNKVIVIMMGLDISLKVNSIYDTTLTATYYKNKYPYRKLGVDDLVKIK